MGSRDIVLGVHAREPEVFQPRKRFKTSELPLSATQRSTIDELLHTIKKKGEYDTLRKKVWSDFVDSDEKNSFTNQLNELADAEIDRDPSFLSRDRGKAATLLQGAVDRSDIYKSVEQSLDRLVSKHLSQVLVAGREIRRAEIGEEAAVEEEQRGNITDEEYAKEAAARREAREQQRQQDEARRRREEEREKVRADFAQKEAELQRLKKREEERLEREATKQRQKEELKKREEERNKLRKREEERIELRRKEEERNELRKREEERKERPREHEDRRRTGGGETPVLPQRTHQRSRSRHRSSGRLNQSSNMSPQVAPEAKAADGATPPTATPLIDEAEVEREALEKLLREGAELAAKSGTKPHLDRTDSVEPPHRRSHTLKPKPASISPLKSMDIRSPMRSEPSKPVLSFSSINARPSEPSASQQPRSKTPPTGPKSHMQYRSVSRSNSRRNGNRRDSQAPDDKTYPGLATRSSQLQDSLDGGRDMREGSHQTQSITREDTRERARSRGFYREDTYDRPEQGKIRHREYDDERRSFRHNRSHSRGPRDIGRDSDRDSARRDRDRRHDRSRPPYKIPETRHDHIERKDSKETLLDSYKPRRGSLDVNKAEEKHRHRDHDSKPGEEGKEVHDDRENEPRRKHDDGYRERREDRDKERPRREEDRYRDRDRDRRRDDREDAPRHARRDDKGKDTEHHRDRHDDRDRDRKERDRDPDRDRKGRDRDRDRDRDRKDDRRDRDRDRGHDRDRREDRRDKDRDGYKDERDHRDSRSKDRRDDGVRDQDRDRDRDRAAVSRGYVAIDRYMPSSGRDDTKRTRERERERDR
ncbi:MAG: hypothetical protein Q9226_007332 [Calogaya cf. arnoldii]